MLKSSSSAAVISLFFLKLISTQFLFFYWSIVNLQYCVNFRYIAKVFVFPHTHTHTHTHTYIHTHIYIHFRKAYMWRPKICKFVCLKLSALACPLESLCTVSYWYSEPWLEDCQASPLLTADTWNVLCAKRIDCVKWLLFLTPFYRWWNWCPESLHDLCRVSHPVSGQQEGKPRHCGSSAQARGHCDFQCLKKRKTVEEQI